MRVSTNQLYAQALNRMTELQRGTVERQEQIASGRRVNRPGDDPVAAASILQLDEGLEAIAQFDRNGVIAEQRLNQVDDVLGGVTNVLQRTRELLIQGRSEALGPGERRAIAVEIREQLDVLVDLGNTRNASGEYIFAGGAVTTRPFTRDASGVVGYAGDQTVRRIQVSESRAVEESFSGHDAFLAIRNGNGTFVTRLDPGNSGTAQVSDNIVTDTGAWVAHDYRIEFTGPDTYDVVDTTLGTTVAAAQPYTSGAPIAFGGMAVTVFGEPAAGDAIVVTPSANQSMFETVRALAEALETPYIDAAGQARFGFALDRAIEDIDQSLEKVGELRATTGARLNTIDAQRATNEDMQLNLQTLRSRLADVDLTAAISQLARESAALEAAQAAFVRVQGLSLFNFL